jgi:hypothetical protein
MSRLYRALTYLVFLGLLACVSGQPNKFAGNDEDKDIGLGGTGMLADSDNGLGGTGIVGEITGFGSIFVNGVEIEYDNETPFTIDGETASTEQLVIGDVVEVLTSDASKLTQARRINLRHEVVGTVESVDRQAGSFSIMGQTVTLQGIDTKLPQQGDSVAVSGMRIDAQTIRATRVTEAGMAAPVLRTHNELPFGKQVTRWLVKARVSNGEAAFMLDGNRHVLALNNGSLEAGIIVLKKSQAGQLVIERIINPAKTPQGRVWMEPVNMPDNQMRQRIAPMRMNMITQPVNTRGGG